MANDVVNADLYNTSDYFYQEFRIVNEEIQTLYQCNQLKNYVSGVLHIDASDLMEVPKGANSYVKMLITFEAGNQLDMPIHNGESTLYNFDLNFNEVKKIEIFSRNLESQFQLKIHGYLNKR